MERCTACGGALLFRSVSLNAHRGAAAATHGLVKYLTTTQTQMMLLLKSCVHFPFSSSWRLLLRDNDKYPAALAS
jgi:hypothetical protein